MTNVLRHTPWSPGRGIGASMLVQIQEAPSQARGSWQPSNTSLRPQPCTRPA